MKIVEVYKEIQEQEMNIVSTLTLFGRLPADGVCLVLSKRW